MQQFLVSCDKNNNNRPANCPDSILIKKNKLKKDIKPVENFDEINYHKIIDMLDNKFNLMIRKHKANPKQYKITSKDVMEFINEKVKNINELDDY